MWLGKNNECHEGRGQDRLDSRLVSRASWHSNFCDIGVVWESGRASFAVVPLPLSSDNPNSVKEQIFLFMLNLNLLRRWYLVCEVQRVDGDTVGTLKGLREVRVALEVVHGLLNHSLLFLREVIERAGIGGGEEGGDETSGEGSGRALKSGGGRVDGSGWRSLGSQPSEEISVAAVLHHQTQRPGSASLRPAD